MRKITTNLNGYNKKGYLNMKFVLKLTTISVVAAALLISCGKKADPDNSGTSGASTDFSLPQSSQSFTLGGNAVTLAGVTFTPATEWTDFGPSGMRKASYAFGPLEGETDSATVTVFYFGQDGGGTIEANLDRWIGQMKDPAGAAMPPISRGEMMIEGMKAHLLKVTGTFAAGGMMMSTPTMKENYLMVGVVLEAPEGNIFFKMTGPEKSGAAMGKALMMVVEAAKKA